MAIFFLIIGYFQILKNKVRVKKIVIETVFYSILIEATAFIGGYGSAKDLLGSVVPLSANTWWYVTSYVVLMLCSPCLNIFFSNLNKRKKLFTIIVVWVFMYCIPYNGAMYYSLERGVLFYLIGAYIRTELELCNLKKKRFLLLLIFSSAWLTYLPIGYYYYSLYSDNVLFNLLFDTGLFNGIIVPVCSIAIFLLFISLDKFCNKWINLISSTAFGVYLIHDNPYRYFIWNKVLNIPLQYTFLWFPICAFFSGIGVFIVAGFFELLRRKSFDFLSNIINNLKKGAIKLM